MSESWGVLLGARPDLRTLRVKLARLVKPGREAVCGLTALRIEVIENAFQVCLSLLGADDPGRQAPPLPFLRRLRTFASVP